MTFSISLGNESVGELHVKAFSNSIILSYPCSSPTLCTFYRVVLPPNRYQFEVWGGSGGYHGGLGGYSSGFLSLQNETEIQVYIGSMGPTNFEPSSNSAPAFNGGGIGANGGSGNRACGSGGGGTDIRIGDSFHHRILVAGGGGGGNGELNLQNIYPGGSGGGFSGLPGSKGYTTIQPPGGNQDGPGVGQEEYGGSSSLLTHSGEFGLGGYGTYLGTHGGGGGGWYGGAGGAPSSHSSGGGGSGYILNEFSFKPIFYSHNSSASFFFENGITKNGEELFPSCIEQVTERGHLGNGCARISIIASHLSNHSCFSSLHLTISFLLILSLIS